ncbi:MAG: LTA synthase family protein [Marinilabiliaceae bacterium]
MNHFKKSLFALVLNLAATLLAWLLTFLVGRLIFIGVNSLKAADITSGELGSALLHGMKFDVSIWGYCGIVTCVTVAIAVWFARWDRDTVRAALRAMSIFVGVLTGIVIFVLPAEAITYRAWNHHVDAGSLMMLADKPSLILASAETWFEIAYVVVMLIVGLVFFGMTYRLCRKFASPLYKSSWGDVATPVTKALTCVAVLVIGGLMIIPIRGGVGLIPLNTGNAYFSQNQFANHVAVNPVWNFLYSTKRAKQADIKYEFMPEADMEARFGALMKADGKFPKIFKVERPNIVVILLESFSAHGIEYLGGINATPNIDSLRHTGLYFNNFFASSDRSGKGLMSVMNAYPSLPTIRVIQFPQKTQNIPSLAQTLRKNGYTSQTFIYGGDINFNNFNSLVNQNGYDHVITQDDFTSDQMGDKWGAHDEYTFERLLSTIDSQPSPFFDFYFTLSSHEPFTVPMERKLENDYLNSMYYTDSCLGRFMRAARKKEWWDRTVFVLLADHGHGGPENVNETDRRKFNIPLIITGGAVAPKDSLVTSYGSQTDLTATILAQIGIGAEDFVFSKNLLDPSAKDFAFFDFSDGFGFVTPGNYEVYDNQMSRYIRMDDTSSKADTISGKAYLQKIAKDFHSR